MAADMKASDSAGAIRSWSWDTDKGKKEDTRTVHAKTPHTRLYAPPGSDELYSPTYGFYVFGTTHFDWGECVGFVSKRIPLVGFHYGGAGYSETVEQMIVKQVKDHAVVDDAHVALAFPDEIATECGAFRPRRSRRGGAREHAKHWYVLHLHASVTIAADSPPGRAYLVASTGSPAAEIRFDVRPDHVIKTTAVGFVDGTQSTVSRDRPIVVRFRNFIPYAGVSPGLNALEVGVQSFGAKIARVTVLGDTSIEYTPLGPANVKVHVSASPTAVVDRRLHITVRLTNTGDRVARELVLSTAFSGARAALVGSVDRPVPELRPGGSRAVGITYIPQAAGRTRYFFLVSSTEPSRHPA